MEVESKCGARWGSLGLAAIEVQRLEGVALPVS
jgi:hypothetical protein